MSGDARHKGDEPPRPGESAETIAPEPGKESWSRSPKAALVPTPAGLFFNVYGKTDVGLVREHNEDNFMIADLVQEAGPLEDEEEVSGVVSERNGSNTSSWRSSGMPGPESDTANTAPARPIPMGRSGMGP